MRWPWRFRPDDSCFTEQGRRTLTTGRLLEDLMCQHSTCRLRRLGLKRSTVRACAEALANELTAAGCCDPHYCGYSPDNVQPLLFKATCYRCTLLAQYERWATP